MIPRRKFQLLRGERIRNLEGPMTKRPLTVVALFCSVALSLVFAADTPPSETSIKKLLEVGRTHQLINTMIEQMDSYMKQIMHQATQGQRITPEIQKDIDKRQTEMMRAVKDVLDWNKLEAMYVRIYQKSFTQDEVDGLVAFYKTPTGQALLTKMPAVMQNTFNEVQQLMQPMMQRMQQMQQEVVAEIQAEKKKRGG
jgi:hypothetical protein